MYKGIAIHYSYYDVRAMLAANKNSSKSIREKNDRNADCAAYNFNMSQSSFCLLYFNNANYK